jgi:hypothetical protein
MLFLRKPKKISAIALVKSVLMAVIEGTPHSRAIAENIAEISDQSPSRQAVWDRLNNEAAPEFFAATLNQVITDQFQRYGKVDSAMGETIENCRKVFKRLIVEDGTAAPLHRSLASVFKGAKNQLGEYAALRLRWALDYFTGKTIDAKLHYWRDNDMSTAFDILDRLKPGDLILRDMGYFCLECLNRIAALGAYYLSRIPEGTVISTLEGVRINLARRLRYEKQQNVGMSVEVGTGEKVVRNRLVGVRVTPAKAEERKRKLRKELSKKGKTPRKDQLTMCEWVVVLTNVGEDQLSGEDIAQLYRARWMVEIFFKGLKSGQGLEEWSCHRTNEYDIQCLAYGHMILGVLSLQLWRTMGEIVNLSKGTSGGAKEGETELRTVGAIMALESLMPFLYDVCKGTLKGQKLVNELHRLAKYATQEKRARRSLDALVFQLLS